MYAHGNDLAPNREQRVIGAVLSSGEDGLLSLYWEEGRGSEGQVNEDRGREMSRSREVVPKGFFAKFFCFLGELRRLTSSN